MRKFLLLLLVVLLLLAVVVPVFADSEDAPREHPDHNPGWDNASRNGNICNHPIPPGWAEADPPGPLTPND